MNNTPEWIDESKNVSTDELIDDLSAMLSSLVSLGSNADEHKITEVATALAQLIEAKAKGDANEVTSATKTAELTLRGEEVKAQIEIAKERAKTDLTIARTRHESEVEAAKAEAKATAWASFWNFCTEGFKTVGTVACTGLTCAAGAWVAIKGFSAVSDDDRVIDKNKLAVAKEAMTSFFARPKF